MADYELEEIKKFNTKLVNVLKQENELQVDSFMVEDVVEYAENSMKWTDHKWKVNLSEDSKTVTRDGVPFDNVKFVGSEYDFNSRLPVLIIECEFNDFDIKMNEDGSQHIFYKGEWIEEVQRYEIINAPENNFITHIRLSILGDIDMNWDFGVERGERENPNVTFAKINYHKDPMLTSKVYKELEGEHE